MNIYPQDHLETLAKALEWADLSSCRKMHFGCVITDLDGRRLGQGYNHSVRQYICDLGCIRDDCASGTHLERCYAVHAEMAALNAIRLGLLYVPWTPLVAYVAGRHPDGREYESDGFSCTFCVRELWEAGVKYIVIPNSKQPDGYLIQTIDEAIDTAYEVALNGRTAYQ